MHILFIELQIINLKTTFLILLVSSGLALLYVYIQSKSAARSKETRELKWEYEYQVLQAKVEMQEQVFEDISRDIHDNICQRITLAKLQVTEARKNPQLLLRDTEELLSTIISDLRALSNSMCADDVVGEGLISAIQNNINLVESTVHLKINFEISDNSFFLDEDKEILIYRIYQEALQNIIKHAGATEVNLSLDYLPEMLMLSIEDNGTGFLAGTTAGKGLKNIEMRSTSLGGTFQINSSRSGTKLVIQIPYEKP